MHKGSETSNAKLPDGTSALHWAVRSDDLELVSLLLHAKADINAADPDGVTPLALACANANVRLRENWSPPEQTPSSPIPPGSRRSWLAVGRPQIENVRMLLEAGAKVDARDNRAQETALMIAVRDNNAAAVRPAGPRRRCECSDANWKDPARRPPGAGGGSHGVGIVRSGWPEQGYQEATPGGMTPLLYAARDGHTEIARMLIAAGAKVNLPTPTKSVRCSWRSRTTSRTRPIC